MADKTFAIAVSQSQALKIAEAIEVYAHAAYPVGGSDCAQVSRDALLDSAKAFSSLEADGIVQVRKRQRRPLKAAVDWYFSMEGPGDHSKGPELGALFER
jgi:hypothetical protein